MYTLIGMPKYLEFFMPEYCTLDPKPPTAPSSTLNSCGSDGLVLLAFRTGSGIPAVLPKWVARVRVRYAILSHRATPHPYLQLYGYFTG